MLRCRSNVSFSWVLSHRELYTSTLNSMSRVQPNQQTDPWSREEHKKKQVSKYGVPTTLALVIAAIPESLPNVMICHLENAPFNTILLSCISPKKLRGIRWIGSNCLKYISRHMLDIPFNTKTMVKRYRSLQSATWKPPHLRTALHAHHRSPASLQSMERGNAFNDHGGIHSIKTYGEAMGIVTHFGRWKLLFVLAVRQCASWVFFYFYFLSSGGCASWASAFHPK